MWDILNLLCRGLVCLTGVASSYNSAWPDLLLELPIDRLSQLPVFLTCMTFTHQSFLSKILCVSICRCWDIGLSLQVHAMSLGGYSWIVQDLAIVGLLSRLGVIFIRLRYTCINVGFNRCIIVMTTRCRVQDFWWKHHELTWSLSDTVSHLLDWGRWSDTCIGVITKTWTLKQWAYILAIYHMKPTTFLICIWMLYFFMGPELGYVFVTFLLLIIDS